MANSSASRPVASLTRLSPSTTWMMRRGRPTSIGNGCRGDCVRGRYHGAEHQTHSPIESRQNPARGGGNAEYREAHQSECEAGDAGEIVSEIAPASDERSLKQQGRQNHEENDIGIQLDVRAAGEKAEYQAADDEHDRIRRAEFLGDGSQRRHEHRYQQKNQFDAVDSCCSHPGLAELKIPQAGEWRANTKSRPDFPGRLESSPMPSRMRTAPALRRSDATARWVTGDHRTGLARQTIVERCRCFPRSAWAPGSSKQLRSCAFSGRRLRAWSEGCPYP